MKIKDYQYITTIPTGSTNFEEQLIDYFKLDRNKKWSEVISELESIIKIKDIELKSNYIKLNGKRYKIEKDLLLSTFEQFVRLDNIIAEGDNVKNLHRLLAIYLRPVKYGFKIEKYKLNNQDKIAEELLELDMDIAQSIMVFFYQYANRYMNNMSIYYLNQMKKTMNRLIEDKLTK